MTSRAPYAPCTSPDIASRSWLVCQVRADADVELAARAIHAVLGRLHTERTREMPNHL